MTGALGRDGTVAEVDDAVPAAEIAFALRRMRREQYRIDSAPDGSRLALLMQASPAGRRNAGEHVVTWLAEQGLRLDVEDPVIALADPDGAPRVVRA
jgi:hypothetical protein